MMYHCVSHLSAQHEWKRMRMNEWSLRCHCQTVARMDECSTSSCSPPFHCCSGIRIQLLRHIDIIVTDSSHVMCLQFNFECSIHIRPFGMMIHLLRQQCHARHHAPTCIEIIKRISLHQRRDLTLDRLLPSVEFEYLTLQLSTN